MIQEQVRLPVRVAFEVVMQGIRIRFGRSMVTIMGVMLGIAFLMSILTGQALKRGVSEEERMRTEVRRMASFLTAEMGPPVERVVGLVLSGQPSLAESRLLSYLAGEGLGSIRWAGYNQAALPPLPGKLSVENVPVQRIGEQASAVLVMGAGDLPQLPWPEILAGTRQQVVGVTGKRALDASVAATLVQLEREARPEEVKRLEDTKRKDRYRGIWIVTVSLLVTIIGISNAMLMSVTERFREIGTMKCLGALSAFVRLMFLIESGFMGVVGGLSGCAVGVLFSIVAYAFSYGVGLTVLSLGQEFASLLGYMGLSMLAGIALSVIAAIYPAGVASRMVPADALRSNV
jgi:hypothetical protein